MIKYKHWTLKEDMILEKSLNEGKSYKEISAIVNHEVHSCHCRASKLKIKSVFKGNRKYKIDHNFWKIPNKLNSYWAGFSAADASLEAKNENNIRFALNLSIKDKSHLERFRNDIGSDSPFFERKFKSFINGKYPSESHIITLRISSNQWLVDLKNNFNIVPNKTFIISEPDLNHELLSCWMVGQIDGDGSISYCDNSVGIKKLNITFITGSITLMKSNYRYVKENFDDCTLSKREYNYRLVRNTYFFNISGVRACVMFDYLNQITDIPKLDRKWKNPEILQHVAENKLKFPHLFKTFEYNAELNQQMIEIPKTEEKISHSPILV